MFYTCAITINRPRSVVSALFQDPDRAPEWQKGLQSITPVSGAPGADGSRAELKFHERGREMTITETIERNAMPDMFNAVYETKGVWNRCENMFTETTDGGTLWQMSCEFRCTGFIRILAALMPGMFRKQTEKAMAAFRAMAESRDAP